MDASGPGSINYTSPKALSALVGMKFKIIAGFPGASDICLEVDGRRSNSSSPIDFGRPFIAPPSMPAERAKMVQDAFMATMKDADFLADEKLDVAPEDGESRRPWRPQIPIAPC